jgi:hypothetical protein
VSSSAGQKKKASELLANSPVFVLPGGSPRLASPRMRTRRSTLVCAWHLIRLVDVFPSATRLFQHHHRGLQSLQNRPHSTPSHLLHFTSLALPCFDSRGYGTGCSISTPTAPRVIALSAYLERTCRATISMSDTALHGRIFTSL